MADDRPPNPMIEIQCLGSPLATRDGLSSATNHPRSREETLREWLVTVSVFPTCDQYGQRSYDRDS